jgi:hypothetical protein
MKTTSVLSLVLLSSSVTFPCAGKEIDRRCLEGDCVILTVEHGVVFAESTGDYVSKREIAKINEAGIPFVPAAEAPIRYAKTDRGWVAVVSAFLPKEFDYTAPELRVYIFDPQRNLRTASDQYNFLGSFNVGGIFHTDAEFVEISTSGSHVYVARTAVWLLPATGPPSLLLDLPGMLRRIRRATPQSAAGLWIDIQTYDGVHAETKGWRPEFWTWSPARVAFILAPGG